MISLVFLFWGQFNWGQFSKWPILPGIISVHGVDRLKCHLTIIIFHKCLEKDEAKLPKLSISFDEIQYALKPSQILFARYLNKFK